MEKLPPVFASPVTWFVYWTDMPPGNEEEWLGGAFVMGTDIMSAFGASQHLEGCPGGKRHFRPLPLRPAISYMGRVIRDREEVDLALSSLSVGDA